MAARGRTPGFYVYRLYDDSGHVLYVGKGSGRRLQNQKCKYRCDGEIVRSFEKEADAYDYEIACIAEMMPQLNVHRGGNGGRATPKPKPRKTKEEREMERIGTRAYVARVLLKSYFYLFTKEQLDGFRAVASI